MSAISVWTRRLLPIVIILSAVAILTAVIVANAPKPEEKESSNPLPLVEVQEIHSDHITLQLKSYGLVQARHQTQLVAEVRGRIVALDARFIAGGAVQEGQILARIEASDYQADLMQAEASLARAEAELAQEVARGKVAEKQWHGASAPDLGLRKPQLAQQQAQLRSAQADLARAKRNLERTVIRAPFSGFIKNRVVDLGQYVSVGTQMGELLGTDVAEIRLPLSARQLQLIDKPGTPTASVLLSESGSEHQWRAQLVRSEQVVDTQSRMIYLVAQLEDPYNLKQVPDRAPLKFGSFVNASIAGRTLANIIRLPGHSVRNDQVMLVDSNNTLQRRQVEVVHRDQNTVYVRGTIQRGERIALTALNSYQNGAQVRVMGEVQKPSTVAMIAEVNANE